MFYFHPSLGNISNLINIFSDGWFNHKLDIYIYIHIWSIWEGWVLGVCASFGVVHRMFVKNFWDQTSTSMIWWLASPRSYITISTKTAGIFVGSHFVGFTLVYSNRNPSLKYIYSMCISIYIEIFRYICMVICIFLIGPYTWLKTWCLYRSPRFGHTSPPSPPRLTLGHLSDFSVVQVAGVILVSPFTSIRECLVVAYAFWKREPGATNGKTQN